MAIKTMAEIRQNEEYQKQVAQVAEQELGSGALQGKSVLITGATGMIGTFLIEVLSYANRNLKANIQIYAVGRSHKKAESRLGSLLKQSGIEFICQNVNQPFKIQVPCDYMIHGASNTHPMQYATHPIGTIEANVIGLKNILKLAEGQTQCRVVFLSSVEVYGENRGDIEKFDESYSGYIDCNTLRAGYPESKRLGEALCQAYKAEKGTDIVIPRLSRVYGPTMQQDDSKAIAQFIRKAAEKEDIILKSEGTQRYSYAYVVDAAAGILRVMIEGKSGEAYNIASKESDLSLKEITQYLSERAGTKVLFELPEESERAGYSAATKAMLDTQKIQRCGWQSSYAMKEGLLKTLEMI